MSEELSLSEQYKANGNSFYQNGQYQDAVECYTKAIAEDPENHLLYHNRAAAHLMLNSYSDAYIDANKSVQLNPSYCKSLLRFAKCCVNLGRIEEARQACTKVRSLEPLNPDLAFQISQIDLLQSSYDGYEKQMAASNLVYSLHLISKCSDLAPGSLPFDMKRLHVLIRLKRFVEAKKRVEGLVSKYPDCIEMLYYRGLCFYYMEHMDKAISHFQRVLLLDPDHVDTQKAFKMVKTLNRIKEDGNKYIHDKRYTKAHAAYTEALSVDPLHDTINAKLFCNRAVASYHLGKYDSSLSDCDNAIALDKSYAKAYARKAKCYAALEQYDEAVKMWSTVVQLDDSRENKHHLQTAKRALAKSKEINYYKVLGLKKTASFEEIKQAYKKRALEHHPDRHTNASEEVKQEQEQKFKEIGQAYSVLSDPAKRQKYDSGCYSPDGLDASQMHARNIFTQVFPGFAASGSSVHFCFG